MKPSNPFKDIAQLANNQYSESNEDDVVRYSGRYEDFSGDPIALETLFNNADYTGTLTINHQNQVTKIVYQAGGAGVNKFKFEAGNVKSLIDTLLALCTQGNHMA